MFYYKTKKEKTQNLCFARKLMKIRFQIYAEEGVYHFSSFKICIIQFSQLHNPALVASKETIVLHINFKLEKKINTKILDG
jgi:hypothetical protein